MNKIIHKLTKYILTPTMLIVIALTLSLFLKGGLTTGKSTAVGGPFESSGSTSRYALTEALVEDKTVLLNRSRASFAAPDVSKVGDKYFSIFAPGVSVLSVPFYLLGKYFGNAQFGAYLATATLALINAYLVYSLSRKLGSTISGSWLSAFIFTFATNALPYALTFTQHHMSTAIVLLSLHNALRERNLVNNLGFGALFGIGIFADIPNAFILMPATLYVLAKHFGSSDEVNKQIITIKTSFIGLIIGLIPFIALFSYYNKLTTDSYFATGQTVGRVADDEFSGSKDLVVKSESQKQPGAKIPLPFDSRHQLRGFYTSLISNERGVLVYTPVALFGLLGFNLARKENMNGYISLLVSTIAMVVVMYASFGDAWGGWAFGARYMIPAAAVASAGVGLFVKNNKNKYLYALLFTTITYSLAVNILGAITTAQIPPKVEAINLLEPIPYTYRYNWQLLSAGKVSALVYNNIISIVLTSIEFAYAIFSLLLLVISSLFFLAIFKDTK